MVRERLLAEPREPREPREPGRFRLLRRLGAGSMGEVWLAHDPQLGRRIAVKMLHARHRRSADAGPRLLREARAMAKVSHRAVVGVDDAGDIDGQRFVAMALVEGRTLGAWLVAEPLGRGATGGRPSRCSARRDEGRPPRTPPACCTATASPTTCASTTRSRCGWRTSGWPTCGSRTPPSRHWTPGSPGSPRPSRRRRRRRRRSSSPRGRPSRRSQRRSRAALAVAQNRGHVSVSQRHDEAGRQVGLDPVLATIRSIAFDPEVPGGLAVAGSLNFGNYQVLRLTPAGAQAVLTSSVGELLSLVRPAPGGGNALLLVGRTFTPELFIVDVAP